MKKIVKRLLVILCICSMIFSISGCVSTANIDNAKSLSANSSYNIDEHNEESVVIDLNTSMSFSEKGTVRFEGGAVELVDFCEYGNNKSNTVYFEGLEKDLFDSYGENWRIEFAFEYKDMIYFLKRNFEFEKYNYTLYRTTLKGEDITKISTITLNINTKREIISYCEVSDVYVQNNSLLFRIEYYNEYSSDTESSKSKIYKIDLKTGISQKLLEENNIWLVGVTYDNDYTYLYTDDFNESRKEKKITIDNKTGKIIVKEYKHGKGEYYVSCMYKDMMVCIDETSENVFMLSTDKEPKTIFTANSSLEISSIQLLGDTLLIRCSRFIFYTYNFKTGKVAEQNIKDDLNKAIYKVGDKYILFIEDEKMAKAANGYTDEYYTYNSYVNDFYLGQWYCECLYWSGDKDVEFNKGKFKKIKNQRIMDYFEYPYSYYGDDDYSG